MELSKNIPFFFFYNFMISFLGIYINVPPKNTLSALNLEWKHKRSVVTYSFPCNIILSAKAHVKVFSSSSFPPNDILEEISSSGLDNLERSS